MSVAVRYEPPAGSLGALGEALGAGGQFERRLQHDLQHFAAMVEQAPPGALDPTSSSYLFHEDSAASKGRTTLAQQESMGMGGDAGVTSSAASAATPPADEAFSDPAIPRIPGTSASPGEQP